VPVFIRVKKTGLKVSPLPKVKPFSEN